MPTTAALNGKRSPNRRYPWERWFSKKRFRIERGRHYKCQTHSMAQQIRSTAPRYGVKVSISQDSDVITVKVVED